MEIEWKTPTAVKHGGLVKQCLLWRCQRGIAAERVFMRHDDMLSVEKNTVTGFLYISKVNKHKDPKYLSVVYLLFIVGCCSNLIL